MDNLDSQVTDTLSEKIRKVLAENIAFYRKERKITRAELAEKVGVSEAAIGQYERGDRSPSIEIVYKLAMSLGVNIDWLIFGNNAARHEDYHFLLKLGLPVEEMSDGTINVYSHSDALLSDIDDRNFYERILEEKKQIFHFKKSPDIIARFRNFQELHICLSLFRDMFFNALGARYLANKYFTELMTKDEIEIKELVLLEKNDIGELPPVEVSKTKLDEIKS